MEKELEYLGNQSLFNSYAKEIFEIIKGDYNQEQLHRGSSLPIAIDCFSLGVIVGKKLERAKHKISNDEVFKRQTELLLKIETLKLKNNRLEKVLTDIREECLNTSEVSTVKETTVKTRVVLTVKKAIVNNKAVLVCTKKAHTKA